MGPQHKYDAVVEGGQFRSDLTTLKVPDKLTSEQLIDFSALGFVLYILLTYKLYTTMGNEKYLSARDPSQR